MTLLIAGILSGCGHEHTWREATCTEPRTCTECGDTEGNPLGHTWIEATCVSPKTCSVCGETEGGVTEHVLNSDGKCTVCGSQIGSALSKLNYKN